MTTAIGALTGLTAGLGGSYIVVRSQLFLERHRQRERAAEVLGAMGPLLTELNPERMYMSLPSVPEGQQDPMTEILRLLDKRTRAVREQLSMLAVWWPTTVGSDVAQRLQVALFNSFVADGWLVSDARRSQRDTKDSFERARKCWNDANSLERELRAEIRGQATPARRAPRVGPGAPWPPEIATPERKTG
jgi:hypothetical protein